jgi:hypothetical protein
MYLFENVVVDSVCHSSRLLFGSTGGCPPFVEAIVISYPLSMNSKKGLTNSSKQNPVFFQYFLTDHEKAKQKKTFFI